MSWVGMVAVWYGRWLFFLALWAATWATNAAGWLLYLTTCPFRRSNPTAHPARRAHSRS